MNQVPEQLRRAPLFEHVSPDLVDTVLENRTTRTLAPGERLLGAGEENEHLYLIVTGSVAVHVASASRSYVQLGPGACVGELSVIDQSPTSADVVAVESTVVVGVHRSQVLALIDASAEAARNLLKILTGRVRHDNVVLAESDQRQAELEQVAMVDATTGLRNRRWLDMAFERQIMRTISQRQPVALLMIDLDDFKDVNDSRGHVAGDAVLRRVAQQLADALRPQDLVARYGGDEFAVLLPNLDANKAVVIAERLRQLVSTVAGEATQANQAGVTISIGVATAREETTLAAMIASADAALYRAKQSGRNRVSL